MSFKRSIFAVFAAIVLAAPMQAQFPPLVPGESVITCFSDNSDTSPVLAVFDTRDPVTNAPGFNQHWPAAHAHPANWNRVTFDGELFGIALDDAPQPNIYVTSTAVYTGGGFTQNKPGTGKIFKVDGGSGAVILLATLPNTKQGLGNIAFNPVHKQLLVTNFFDGKIYRLALTPGAPLSTFDPFGAYDPTKSTVNGFAPVGERLWGIGVFSGRAYFARWAPSSVWSVALDATTGDFVAGTERIELSVPPLSSPASPVADIEFTGSGEMLLAERGMIGNEVSTAAHQSRVLKYVTASGAWTASSQTFGVGDLQGAKTNASGGVSSVCPLGKTPEKVIFTGDALQFGKPQVIYGLQIAPATGGDVTSSYLIDVDGNLGSSADKTQSGDVDVYNTCDRCTEIVEPQISCTTDGSGDFIVKFRIRNLSSGTVYHAYLVGLSGGATASQTYFPLTGGLGAGLTSGVFQTRIHGAVSGQAVSFQLTLHDQNLDRCCASIHTLTMPACECAQLTASVTPGCLWRGDHSYTFTVQNLFNGPVSYVLIAPDTPAGAAFSPNVIPVSPPMQYGESRTFTITLSGTGGASQACFRISLHNENFAECCSIRVCVPLRRCWWYYDYDFEPIGDTHALATGNYLTIDSPTNEPGGRFPLPPGTTGVALEWLPVEGALAAGSYLEQRFEGTIGDRPPATIATTRTTLTAAGSELNTTFPDVGATRYRYEFFRDGAHVGSQGGVGPDVAAMCNGCGGVPPQTDAHFTYSHPGDHTGTPADSESLGSCNPEVGYPCLFAGYTFKALHTFQLAGYSTPYEADEVRVFPEDGRRDRVDLSSLTFQARGPSRITFTSFSLAVDEPATGDLDLSLDTGSHQGGTLPGGSADADWRITNVAPEQAARVVTTPNAAWPAALPGSRWISAGGASGASVPGVSTLQFENCFCIGSGATSAELDLQLRADDLATLFLNDVRISDTGGSFAGAPMTVHLSGAVGGDGPFRPGRNCLRVEVNDFGGIVTGLDLTGSIKAANGACESTRP